MALAACRSPEAWRAEADRQAAQHIGRVRTDAGLAGEFTIEQPSEQLRRRLIESQGLPSVSSGALEEPSAPAPPAEALPLSLADALRVGARNNREYQDTKENVFRAALALDVQQEEFRHSLAAVASGAYHEQRSGDPDVRGMEGAGSFTAGRTFTTGASIATRLAVDVVKLLTLDRDSAYGLLADATVTVPLWRGAGREVVMEPMRQAERNLLYALHEFERFRRAYAVRVANEYLSALQQMQSARHAAENEERISIATRRAEQLAQAGRLPEVQVDQARQDLLRARERTIAARLSAEQRLDQLKLTLGLPADARVSPDAEELERLAAMEDRGTTVEGEASGGEIPPQTVEAWIRTALENRLDLRTAFARVEDARRAVRVAADALRAGLSLELSGKAGERRSLSSASSGDARLDPDRGDYAARLNWDWPWRRAAERNAYRESLLALDRAERNAEEMEDRVKSQVRAGARDLAQARQSLVIQRQAVAVARRRIESVDLFLQAGRAQIRDLLEAQEALVTAQNALTAAIVSRRLAELSLQRDLERLELDEEGLWQETTDEMEP